MTPERFIQNQICSYLRLRGAFIFIHDSVGIYDPKARAFRANRSPYRIRGVADILGIFRGRPLAVEVKSAKGRVSEHQAAFLAEWKKHGGIAVVARCVEDVAKALQEAYNLQPDDCSQDKTRT